MRQSEAESDERGLLADACRRVFGVLDEGVQAELLDALELVDVLGGSPLFLQGEPGDSLYILLRGRLNVRIRDDESGEERLVGETSPGETVGEIGLLTGEPRTASLWATRDSRLARIDRESFDALAERHPDLLRSIARVVIDLLQKRTGATRFSLQLTNIAILPTRARNGAERFAKALAQALAPVGPTLCVGSEDVEAQLGVGGRATSESGSLGDARLGDWLGEQERKHRFVLLVADAEPTAWTRLCLRQADLVLVVARSDGEPTPGLAERESSEQADSRRGERRMLVLLHPERDAPISGTARWLEDRDVDSHHHIRAGVAGDIERLARIVSGSAIGLVLGGGGARGFAHAGVYRALREHGVPIDWVGGSSIGSVFGAGIAMDWDPQRVEEEAHLTFVREKPFGDFTVPLVSLVRGKRIERLARRSFPIDIEDMPIPYFCVSSNLSAATLTVHERGPLWQAIRASVSLPGILPPAVKSQHLAIDGGILNNLPVDVMRDRSVGSVIAVDLAANKEERIEYPEVPSPLRILLSRLPFVRDVSVPGIVTLLMKATVVASAVHAKSVREDASLLLNPPVERFGLLAMSDFEEIVEVGYRYGCERLADWERPSS